MRYFKLGVILTAILVASFLVSTRVITAFSVGHLTVKRNSERGFVAELPFELSKGERGKRVEVSLGEAGHYALLGEDRPKELERMWVRVDRRRGKAYIGSDTPLHAPVDLIVKVAVDGGAILKKFPIALKSTLKPSSVRAAVETTRRVTVDTTRRVAVDTTRRVAERLRKPKSQPKPVVGTYGPVRRGETLWQISRQLGGEELPLESVLVALWRGNPEEFAFGNMHALRTNSYLDCSNLHAVADGISLNEARQIIHDQWRDWKKIKFVRAASHKPALPLVGKMTVVRAEERTAPSREKVAVGTLRVPAFPPAQSVHHHLKAVAVERRQEAEAVIGASEQRKVLAREASTGPLAQLQMGVRRAPQVKREEASEQPMVAAGPVSAVPEEAEAGLAPDLAKLKKEITSTKEMLIGRISGLEGELTERFLRSDRTNQVFYGIFVVENLALLVILLISMRRRRARERLGRAAQPARSRVYVRNALHQRYL